MADNRMIIIEKRPETAKLALAFADLGAMGWSDDQTYVCGRCATMLVSLRHGRQSRELTVNRCPICGTCNPS